MIDNSLLKNTNAMMEIISELSEYKFTHRNGDNTSLFSITGFYISSARGTPFIELSEVDIQGYLVKDGDSVEVELPEPKVKSAYAVLLGHGLVPVVMVPEASSYTTEPEEEEPEEDEQECDCPLCSAQDTESLSALFDLIFGLDKDFKN